MPESFVREVMKREGKGRKAAEATVARIMNARKGSAGGGRPAGGGGRVAGRGGARSGGKGGKR